MNLINPAVPLKALPQNGGVQEPELAEKTKALRKQVDEFASMLFTQMVTEMRESGKQEDESEDGSGNEGIFGGGSSNYLMYLFDQEVGKSLAQQGGKQLTDALYKQLSDRMNTQEANKVKGPTGPSMDTIPTLPTPGVDSAIQRGLGKIGGAP